MRPALKLVSQQDTPLPRRLSISLAADAHDTRAALALRYRVFVQEMGAQVEVPEAGIERDRFDAHCDHLLVRDLDRGEVVGCYRILTDEQALRAGGYYSETEFDLTRVLSMPGRFLEVGRSCVHPDYRDGAVIGLLWRGLAEFACARGFDYLIGCVSVPLSHGVGAVRALYEKLQGKLCGAAYRVFPRTPLPPARAASFSTPLPPLLKAYLRAGATLGGEPAWDPHFNVADFFVLLSLEQMTPRYVRRFLPRATLAR